MKSIKIKPIDSNQDIINLIKKEITSHDKILIGAGAGLSAAGGLDYSSEGFFKTNYKAFYNKGYKTVTETINDNWQLTESNAKKYWGFWSYHIYNMHHNVGELKIYKHLYDLVKTKDYFVITTNVDEQFYKSSFNPERVFSMQGSYGLFQCMNGCHRKVYDNKLSVIDMREHFDEETLETSVVPKCPKCGGLMNVNLRIDSNFIENESYKNRKRYMDFLSHNDDKILLLELGVGYNTPMIIRHPFDDMVLNNKKISLVRVNKNLELYPYQVEDRVIYCSSDIRELLN